MKGLKVLLFGMCMALCACSSQTSTVQTSDKGTRWQWENGTIVVASARSCFIFYSENIENEGMEYIL